jgi:polyisoprenoid-binding protein YceI
MRRILIPLLLFPIAVFGQEKFFTRSGEISFHSSTPVEDIEAHNKQVSCILDMSTGEMAISLQMKGFQFEKALMQEHFNENYVESDKYPKASFTGRIEKPELSKLGVGDEIPVTVSGNLTLHGVTRPVTASGTIQKLDDRIAASAAFEVAVADYEIKVPNAVIKNIAEKIRVTVVFSLEPYAN